MRSKQSVLLFAFISVVSAQATVLNFAASDGSGSSTVSFQLDTAAANSYSPTLYPDLPVRGVFLDAVHNLAFEGTTIPVTDLVNSPGQTGTGDPLTVMEVGPLFDTSSLSVSLLFRASDLVSPLSSLPAKYEESFYPFQSVLFPPTPPPRTHVVALQSMSVTEVPELSPRTTIIFALLVFCAIALIKELKT